MSPLRTDWNPADYVVGIAFLELVNQSGLCDKGELAPEQAARLLDDAVGRVSAHDSDLEGTVRWLRRRAERLRACGAGITSMRSTSWWFEDVDRRNQVFVGQREPAITMLDGDIRQFPADVLKPLGGIWTSTHLAEIGSSWLLAGRHSAWQRRLVSSRCWKVTVSQNARVLEIHCSKDVQELYRRYPANATGRVDWPAVAGAWDAVHLSVAGLIETHPVVVLDGTTTAIMGWDAESTVWFRWCFDDVREMSEQP